MHWKSEIRGQKPKQTSNAQRPIKGGRQKLGIQLETSFALRLICVPDNATDTGQVFFVSSACSLNFASSIPGASASVIRLIEVILKPPPEGSSFTSAVVLIFLIG